MQTLPYNISKSMNIVIDKLKSLGITYTIALAHHSKGRCREYKNRIVTDMCDLNCDIKHGAYVLVFQIPPNDTIHDEIERMIDTINHNKNNDVMVEEPGKTELAVRTVKRKRTCVYCRNQIPRGDKYIRRIFSRREETICRNCAEQELIAILKDLQTPSGLPPKGTQVSVQKW